jgi:hypothetical protein
MIESNSVQRLLGDGPDGGVMCDSANRRSLRYSTIGNDGHTLDALCTVKQTDASRSRSMSRPRLININAAVVSESVPS